MTLADYLLQKPERNLQWNPHRNTVKPEEISFGSRKRLWWLCPQGHEWQAPVYSVTAGCGCPYCTGKRVIPGETDLAAVCPELLPFWHESNAFSPEQVAPGSHKKALWRCAQGHVWESVIASVAVDGCGCPYCAGKLAIPGETDVATLCPDVAAQWDSLRNGGLKPEEVLPSAHDKVWWLCELGHSYQAVVFSRTRERASGCPYCTGRKVLPGFNDLATRKPKVAQEWHPALNLPLKPEDVTPGSNKQVWWQCRAGHVWKAAIYSRTRKKAAACPVCAGTVKPRQTAPKNRAQRPAAVRQSTQAHP